MEYIVQLVGAKLEILNGLQYDLANEPRPGNVKNDMKRHLRELADQLCAEPASSADNSGPLRWPLAGEYHYKWTGGALAATGFPGFRIDLYFENEPDWRMTVNALIEINALVQKVDIEDSSSSSYIATGSSR